MLALILNENSKHVYIRPEVNSNRFEISNCFKKLFRLPGTFNSKQPWNLKPLSKLVPFAWGFYCGNCPNHSKTLMHMCKRYILINANLIDAKKTLWYWFVFLFVCLFVFQQQQQGTCALVINFNDSAQL